MEQLRGIILVGLTVAVGELYQCLMVPAYSTANSFIYGQNNAFVLMQDSFPRLTFEINNLIVMYFYSCLPVVFYMLCSLFMSSSIKL